MNAEKIKISQYTFALLECINSLNKHNEQVFKTLSDYFGDNAADNLMEHRYYPAMEELKKALTHFLMVSIERNIDVVDFEEI